MRVDSRDSKGGSLAASVPPPPLAPPPPTAPLASSCWLPTDTFKTDKLRVLAFTPGARARVTLRVRAPPPALPQSPPPPTHTHFPPFQSFLHLQCALFSPGRLP
jgi:hypothetical protein